MATAPAPFIFFRDKIVPWNEAELHVFSPAVKYGAGVFEGIRGYWNEDHNEMYVFRLQEHLARLQYSQRVMRMEPAIDSDFVAENLLEVVRANKQKESVHIRPTVHIEGYGESSAPGPTVLSITTVPRPMPKRVTHGCTAQVSSWQRASDTATPMRAKANANYNNARYAAAQAKADGYESALMLNHRGKVSEGPGMCFFMVRNGVPITPTVTSDILESITRETILQLFREQLDIEPVERDIDRSEIYGAEEAFYCGTGWEVTPVISVDKFPLGDGTPGPLTKKLQTLYFDLVHGKTNLYQDWLTPVYARV